VLEGKNGRRQFLLTGAETNGSLVEMRMTYRPGSPFPPAHFHPLQTETFVVESGEMVVRIDGEESVKHAGDQFVVGPGAIHQMRNGAADAETTLNWRVEPALGTAEFFATSHRLSGAGRLEQALLAWRFRDEFRVAGSALTRAAIPVLAAVARLLGKRLPDPAG
jgi:quercetin dioxygenase-like cupin family protein